MKFYIKKAKKVIRSKTFANRTNDIWINLPEGLVEAPTLNAFKNGLDHHWRNEGFLHDFKMLYIKYRDSTQQQEFEFDEF